MGFLVADFFIVSFSPKENVFRAWMTSKPHADFIMRAICPGFFDCHRKKPPIIMDVLDEVLKKSVTIRHEELRSE